MDPAWGILLATFLTSRLVLEVVGWVARWRVPGGKPPQPWPMPDTPTYIDMWIRWDSQWFLEIARQGGYWFREDGLPMSQAFFPLYPLLMRLLAPVFGGQLHLAGLFIANAGAVAGLWCLHRLAADRFGPGVAARAVTYAILFPAGFYLSALYTEGLYFGFVTGAFLAAARGRWWLAGLLGMGAALTRNTGVFLAVPLGVQYLMSRGEWVRQGGAGVRGVWTAARRLAAGLGLAWAWLLLIPMGLGLYMGYLQVTTGNPLAYVEAEHRWGRQVHYPWVGVAQAIARVREEPPPPPNRVGVYHNAYRPPYRRVYSALDLSAIALVAGLALYGWRRGLPAPWLLFLLTFVFPLMAPVLTAMTPLPSMHRYAAVLFPIFISLALLAERPWVDRAVMVAFPILQGLFFLLFTTWNWIA